MAKTGICFVKLVQLNIWQGRLLREVLQFLEGEKPDFICMQEIYSSSIDTRTHDFLAAYEKIQAQFPSYHGYFSAVCDIPILDKKVLYGNALLSRFPVEDVQTHFVSEQYYSYKTSEEYTENEGQLEGSNVQKVVIRLNDGRTFTLLNHHGYWEPSEIGSEITVQKMEKVADIIKGLSKPIIFAGDMNIIAESPAMKPIHELLRNLTKEHNVPTTLSQFGKVSGVACDHICISEGIAVNAFTVRDELISDHKALVLEFDLDY